VIAFAREPARNLNRFYVLAMTRDLFGGWMLWREWAIRQELCVAVRHRRTDRQLVVGIDPVPCVGFDRSRQR
jgi:hypothetical protein